MLPKNTRIGILAPITWNLPPKEYGPWELVTTNLARGLIKAGYNVRLYATNAAHIEGALLSSVIEAPLGEMRVAHPAALEKIHASFAVERAQEEVDILHNHFNYHAVLLGNISKIPIVTTLHGVGSEQVNNEIFKRYKHLPYVSISNAERTFMPELNYVSTVYNSVDLDTFTFNSTPKDYLVCVSRIHPTKGTDLAIELALRVGKSLHIAGPIHDQEFFDQKVKPFIDDEKIIYHGNLNSHKVHELVSHALAKVALIRWPEPFGLSVAESLASGTPVIATPLGSHTELIQNDVTGLLVHTVEEAVERFESILSIDRLRCRARAEEMFSNDRMTNEYVRVYERILAHPEDYRASN